jgi:hypothetical protein
MNLLTRLGRRLSRAGIVVTVGGVAVLATIVAYLGRSNAAVVLAPPADHMFALFP